MAWVRMHLKATCNINKSNFNDWFTGHLNFQIDLFPMMPRHNLYKIQSYVQASCQKHDINYVIKPLFKAFIDIFLSLELSGRVWRETYLEFVEST
ncbi:unnamed protein product [Didymodactylos carnosus]|uniref:Uncharacterized protein n=1 Tax=Didymodactylos carnosus TaxID=1234261 RepID=A0A814HSY7_9BILA|nr:unnamed protein product [Didymodactylos carnosus]CAF3784895.1 unnamed protein product [Didymodactylos carnosus]